MSNSCQQAGMDVKIWEFIPSEILEIILKNVSFEDLVSSVQFVCWHWKNTMMAPSFWNNVCFKPPLGMKSDRVIELLKESPLLKSFEFREGLECDRIFIALCSSNKKLTNLAFGPVDIGENIAMAPESFLDLEYLQIPLSVFMTNDCLGKFPKLKKLKCTESLDCEYTWRQDNAEFTSEDWPSIQDLNLNCEYGIPLISQLLFFRGPQLLSLTLHGVADSKLLEPLKYCKRLEKLSLNFLSAELAEKDLEICFDNMKNLSSLQFLCLISFVHRDIDVLCKVFQEASFRELISINLNHCLNFSPKVAKSIVNACPQLQVLKLQGSVTVDNDCLCELSKCLTLKHLDISGCKKVRCRGLNYMTKCPKLGELCLDWMGVINGSSLKQISKMRELHMLSLNNNIIDHNALLTALQRMPQLKNLYVNNTVENGKLFQAVLQNCHVHYSKSSAANYIAKRSSIEVLHLNGITEEILQSLLTCTNLMELSIDFLMRPFFEVSAFMPVLQKLQKLRKLVLKSFVSFEGTELNALFDGICYPELQELNLQHCLSLHSVVIKSVAQQCPNLERLNLQGCMAINYEALEAVGQMKKLTCLDLTSCVGMIGCDFSSLGNCKDLKELHLSGLGALSFEVLKFILTFQSLEVLYIDLATGHEEYLQEKKWKLEEKVHNYGVGKYVYSKEEEM